MRLLAFGLALALALALPACSLPRGTITPTDAAGTMDSNADTSVVTPDGGADSSCTGPVVAETCNELDDDCDGRVDETFTLDTDLANCGACGTVCAAGDHGTATCVAGDCGLECDPAFLDCNGLGADGCEASISASTSCGSCDLDCTATPATPLCMENAGMLGCVDICGPGTEPCGASCVDTETSVANCGGCGDACPSAAMSTVMCVSGNCEYTCAAGFEDCDSDEANGCEVNTRTLATCGSCTDTCVIPHASASCATGTCTRVSCDAGFDDCNADPTDGCERAIDTLMDCGSCGAMCMRPNASASCVSGVCTLGVCTPGFGDCDTSRMNGCEADFTSPMTCGNCTTVCAAGQACRGTCVDPTVVSEVGTGDSFSCARMSGGTVYCWGENGSGQLGNGMTTDTNLPVQVSGITDAVDLAVGTSHACVAHATGAVSCWGANNRNQAGDDTSTSPHSTPYSIPGVMRAREVAAGAEHSCLVRTTGTVACWGRNDHGQLGIARGQSGIPMDIPSLTSIARMDAGGKFNCSVSMTGELRCWGENNEGQIGDGSTTDRTTPVLVAPSVVDARTVSCGQNFACVVHNTNVIECWGANDHGQLGDGTTTGRGTFAGVMGFPATSAAEASCGLDHTCARTTTGSVFCWGANSGGQLGDTSFMERLTAVSVSGSLTGVISVGAGFEHSCAASNRAIRCWGSNVVGQLGDGTITGSNVPVMVMGVPPP